MRATTHAGENRIALSFDVEDWYQLNSVTGSPFAPYRDVEAFLSEHDEWNDLITKPTLRLLDRLDELDIEATFFVVAEILPLYPKIVERLRQSDHEIACHDWKHVYPPEPGDTDFERRKQEWQDGLFRAKANLEETFGRPVIGYRAPYARLRGWMLPTLEAAGIVYDSSLAVNSFYSKSALNDAALPTVPFRLRDHVSVRSSFDCNLVELPWSSLSVGPVTFPAGGAFFFRLFGHRYFNFAIRTSLERGDSMFYIHPLELSEDDIPMHNSRKRPIYWINKGERAWRKLNALLEVFTGRWTTCREVCERVFTDTDTLAGDYSAGSSN